MVLWGRGRAIGPSSPPRPFSIPFLAACLGAPLSRRCQATPPGGENFCLTRRREGAKNARSGLRVGAAPPLYPISGGVSWGAAVASPPSHVAGWGETRPFIVASNKWVPLPIRPQSAAPTGAEWAEEQGHNERATQGGARFQRCLPWAGMFRAFSASAALRPGKRARLALLSALLPLCGE